MSEGTGGPGIALTVRQYRWLDRGTKLAGVALIGAGLNAGGDTATGVALGAIGVAIGVSTVIIDNQ